MFRAFSYRDSSRKCPKGGGVAEFFPLCITPSNSDWVSIIPHSAETRVAIMNQRPPHIETERLLLVVLLAEEIEALIAGNRERAEHLIGFRFPPDDPNRGVDLSWHLRALREDQNQRPWRIRVIVERSSGAVVGSINLKGPPNAEGDVEIGWGLNDDVSGKGYATEASAAAIDWVKKQPGVTTISATIPDDNHASKRLAGRLGFARTNDTRRNLPLWRIH